MCKLHMRKLLVSGTPASQTPHPAKGGTVILLLLLLLIIIIVIINIYIYIYTYTYYLYYHYYYYYYYHYRYTLQRGAQRRQGVVSCMVLCTILLCNTTPIHCTPLPLHPPVMNTHKQNISNPSLKCHKGFDHVAG